MIFVKLNDKLYPAEIFGKVNDRDWDNRESKAITLEMGYTDAIKIFKDGLHWTIVTQEEIPVYEVDENGNIVLDENSNPIQTGTEIQEEEFDNSEFVVAGDITDHRDGSITVKMGKYTALEEAYEIMLGGI